MHDIIAIMTMANIGFLQSDEIESLVEIIKKMGIPIKAFCLAGLAEGSTKRFPRALRNVQKISMELGLENETIFCVPGQDDVLSVENTGYVEIQDEETIAMGRDSEVAFLVRRPRHPLRRVELGIGVPTEDRQGS